MTRTPYFLENHGPYYIDFLENFHNLMKPKNYFEIGTQRGKTLCLAKAPSIAVDPNFILKDNVIKDKKNLFLFQMTSDAFFEKYDIRNFFQSPVSMAFLDGMHLFEYLLRDFINTEKVCSNNSVVFMHDCLPCDTYMVTRYEQDPERAQSLKPNWWTGDVWKVIRILKEFRPDLLIKVLDAAPTGLVMVTNLNPNSETLSANYSAIVQGYFEQPLKEDDLKHLREEFSVEPASDYMSFEQLSVFSWL